MSAPNTRDCPELYKKNEIKSSSGIANDQDDEFDEENDFEVLINQVRERFPLCSLKMIQDTLRRKGYEQSIVYLQEKHTELERIQAKKKTGNFEGLNKAGAFPKLSVEREWEIVDELEDWEKVDHVKQKTWAEKLKDSKA